MKKETTEQALRMRESGNNLDAAFVEWSGIEESKPKPLPTLDELLAD
jgi:hypothetical protein